MGTLPFGLQERLCVAARDGPVENIWALVKEGADVVRCDAKGFTALHYAAFKGNVEIVRVVLELGGNAHARYVAPLSLGAEKKVHTASRLVEMEREVSNDGVTPLHMAASAGHLMV